MVRNRGVELFAGEILDFLGCISASSYFSRCRSYGLSYLVLSISSCGYDRPRSSHASHSLALLITGVIAATLRYIFTRYYE